jgi:hypothetical protein
VYSCPFRARINLLLYGRVFVALTEETDVYKPPPELPDHFIWKLVYSHGQYDGYIYGCGYFVPSPGHSLADESRAEAFQDSGYFGVLASSVGTAAVSLSLLIWHLIKRKRVDQ